VALERIELFLRDAEKRNLTVLLAGVRPEMEKIMHNLHFHDWLPADRVYLEKKDKYSATLDAVRHAYKLLSQSSSENGLSYQDREIAYYLV
jgi:SulP family sulfate permease